MMGQVNPNNLETTKKKDISGTLWTGLARRIQSVWTTIDVSSIQDPSISKVNTLDTPNLSSPPRVRRRSLNAILSCWDQGFASVTLSGGLRDIMSLAQLSTIRVWPSPSHRSAKPSEARMRNRGRRFVAGVGLLMLLNGFFVKEILLVLVRGRGLLLLLVPLLWPLSSRRWLISGSAVIYGGVMFRTRNSSHGEVLWNPGNRLYRIRRVKTGDCLNGMSPKPEMPRQWTDAKWLKLE